MRALFCVLAATAALAAPWIPAHAEQGTPDQAVAMVKRAVALIKSDGRAKAFAAIADVANPSFHERDLYIYVYDLNGQALAHGNNPKMVGKPLIGLRDVEGKPVIQEMVELAKSKGKGWVDYKWPNPVTHAVETKSGYVERLDDMLVGSGVYK
ncbi:cache domain-containing protein [Rugamonas apoptosis]|uniref:Cache domain-containing protein n=1 Tax=Rugamonas apoptosis TaxID=2758570 RepID=A0A7W2FAS5_9BURK|nr:cache domain-containing protein [Rugamonas apoptosis]MBA5688271.1 cache domain-containing protein [Rugamonas apoptosis]